MSRLTAAHPTWPLGSIVRVTSLRTGRTVVVRLNDRGPFVDSRVIDLSRAAARKLDLVERGIEPVLLELLSAEPG
jgi:rare lipoprotein A